MGEEMADTRALQVSGRERGKGHSVERAGRCCLGRGACVRGGGRKSGLSMAQGWIQEWEGEGAGPAVVLA